MPPPAGGAELRGLTFAVVDVETTGMSPLCGDRVTEVAAVVVRDGVVTDRFQTLVNPERPIPPRISALTHITNDMVRHAPPFRVVRAELADLLAGRVFVAHNAGFDWRFLSAEMEFAGGGPLGGRRLCTVRLARRLLPELPSRRLDALARHYGIAIESRHRAMGDADATARILLRLLEHAELSRGCRSWRDLDALQCATRRQRERWRPPSSISPESLP